MPDASASSSASPDLAAVKTYLLGLQENICRELAAEDGSADFVTDNWIRPEGGGGRTRILPAGAGFEKAGGAFSHVTGDQLPPSATAHRPHKGSRGYYRTTLRHAVSRVRSGERLALDLAFH